MLSNHNGNGNHRMPAQPKPQKLSHRFLDYRVAMHHVAQIADSREPAYVRIQALKTIIREVSPNNPNHKEVMRQLNGEPPKPVATFVNGYVSRETQEACLEAMLGRKPKPAAEADLDESEDGSGEEEDDPL